MPDRLIRESALTSESLGQLSDFAERLFWRLTTAADDYGRFIANPAVVSGRCVPLVSGANLRRIKDALIELETADTIRLYEADGKQFGYFPAWSKYQQTRAKKSKYPDPPASANKCLQVPTSETNCSTPAGDSHTHTDTHTHTHTDTHSISEEDGESEGKGYPSEFEAALAAYPKRAGSNPKGKAFAAWRATVYGERKDSKPVAPALIFEGVRRYRLFCEATGKIATETVMQAARFFGPECEWRNSWELPRETARASPLNGVNRNQLEMDRIKARMARTAETEVAK